jgi:hypothetical protein
VDKRGRCESRFRDVESISASRSKLDVTVPGLMLAASLNVERGDHDVDGISSRK